MESQYIIGAKNKQKKDQLAGVLCFNVHKDNLMKCEIDQNKPGHADFL